MCKLRKNKLSKKYYKLIKDNNKNLVKIAKETRPWDFGWMLDSIVANLTYMRDYYANGENVIGMDDYVDNSTNVSKTRLQMIDELLSEYASWHNCDEKYFKLISHPETCKTHKGENGTIVVDDFGWHIEYLFGDAETTNKLYREEYLLHKHKFFELLEKYIEELWD